MTTIEQAAGLRAFADWLEQNGDELVRLHPWLARADEPIRNVPVGDRQELAEIAGLMGRVDRVEIDEPFDETEQREGSHSVMFIRDFGGGVTFYAHGAVKDLCEPVDELVSPEPIQVRNWVAPPILALVQS